MIDNGTIDFTGASFAVPLSLDAVSLNGTLLLAGDLTIITGPDTFTLPGALTDYFCPTFRRQSAATSYGLLLFGGTLGGSGTVSVDTTSLLGWWPVQLNTALVNNGSAVLSNNANFTIGAGASLTNAAGATLQMAGGATPVGPGTLINQAGATLLVAPTAQQNYVNIQVAFTNAGLVLDAGVPLTVGGGSSSGSYVADPGSVLAFQGTQTFTTGSAISSAGTVQFNGTATVAGSYSVSGTNTTSVAGSVTFSGPVNINGSQLVDNGMIDLTAASLASPLSLDAVFLNGTLLLGGDLTITGPDTFTLPGPLTDYLPYLPAGAATSYGLLLFGGTLGGSGTVSVDTTSFLGWQRMHLNTALVNNGSAVETNNNPFTIGAGASLTNATGATLQMAGGATPVGSGTLINQAGATLLVVPTAQQNYVNIQVVFTKAGLVHEAGVPLTVGGGSSSGSYVAGPGSVLAFQGTQTFTTGSIISSAGTVQFNGTATVAGSYSVSGTNTTSVGGSATFSGPVNINGSQLVDNGTIDFTAASFASALSLDAVYLNGTLLLGGDLTINGPATFSFRVPLTDYLPYLPAGAASSYGLLLLGGTLGSSGTVSVDTTSFLGWQRVRLNTALVNHGSAVETNNNTFTIGRRARQSDQRRGGHLADGRGRHPGRLGNLDQPGRRHAPGGAYRPATLRQHPGGVHQCRAGPRRRCAADGWRRLQQRQLCRGPRQRACLPGYAELYGRLDHQQVASTVQFNGTATVAGSYSLSGRQHHQRRRQCRLQRPRQQHQRHPVD